MKILHLGIDSSFVDFLVARFEQQAPGSNELVQVTRGEPPVRAFAYDELRTWVEPSAQQVEEVRARASEVDVVVVHAMSDFAALVCAQLPERVVLVWSGFGFDYYHGASGVDLYGPQTLALLRRLKGGKQPDASGRLVLEDQPGRLEPIAIDLVRQAVARRTDYFSAPSPADLDVFSRAYPAFHGAYRQLNYGDLPSMSRTGDALTTGDDVLVGNSASWTNNHLEAFRLLAATDLGSRRVVVPLTYGDPGYRDAVIRRGHKMLGDNFMPIVDHLPIEEYLDLVAGCGVVMLHHRRQQGVGNIVAALQQGSHLFLDRRNPLHGWLRERGVHLRPAAAVKKGLPSGPVQPEALARNRAFLVEEWSPERVDVNLATMLEELARRVSAAGRRGRLRRRLPGRRSQ